MSIEGWGQVTIGRHVLMNNADLFTSQHYIDDPGLKGERRFISIGDYAWLPHKIIILPGVRIGSHAVVGTGSVVSRDVPDYAVAVGNPARVVKERARIKYSYNPTSSNRPWLGPSATAASNKNSGSALKTDAASEPPPCSANENASARSL